MPVSEETPQFRNFFISDVVCNGAAKAIFVRGLPEMNVKNIVLENMTLQANEGVDMTEGSDIVFRNIRLITKNTDPVVNIHNSRNITFDKLTYNEGAELLFHMTGEKTSAVSATKTNLTKAKQKTKFNFGAAQSVFQEK